MDAKGANLSKGLPAPTGDQRLDSIHQEILRQLGDVVNAPVAAGTILADGWYRQTTPAPSTNIVVLRFATSAADSTQFYPIFEDCYLSQVRMLAWGGPSAGTLTGAVYKNTVNMNLASPPQVDAADPFVVWENEDPELYVFAPGDRAEFRVSMTADWDPTTTELLAQLKFTLL